MFAPPPAMSPPPPAMFPPPPALGFRAAGYRRTHLSTRIHHPARAETTSLHAKMSEKPNKTPVLHSPNTPPNRDFNTPNPHFAPVLRSKTPSFALVWRSKTPLRARLALENPLIRARLALENTLIRARLPGARKHIAGGQAVVGSQEPGLPRRSRRRSRVASVGQPTRKATNPDNLLQKEGFRLQASGFRAMPAPEV